MYPKRQHKTIEEAYLPHQQLIGDVYILLNK